MIQIILTEENLQVWSESSVLVDTTFYLQCEDVFFPFEQWTDFSNDVLSMWTENLIQHFGEKRATYKLYFRDGPYWIDVEQNNKELILKGINNHYSNKRVEFTCSCSYESFLSELARAFNKLEKITFLNMSLFGSKNYESIISITRHYKKEIEYLLTRPF